MSRKNKNIETQPGKINRFLLKRSDNGHVFDFDYDSERDDDGYFRINNAKVTDVYFKNVIEEFAKHYSTYSKQAINPTIFNYCLHRLLVINKLYTRTLWNVCVCRGYYGEEANDASLVCAGNPRSLQLRGSSFLELEYGYILDSLKGVTFDVKSIRKKDLIAGNEYYQKKIEKGTYSKEYKLPIGVYLESGSELPKTLRSWAS
jgi:ferredoxin-thioredoxin reductase catalytic subunit